MTAPRAVRPPFEVEDLMDLAPAVHKTLREAIRAGDLQAVQLWLRLCAPMLKPRRSLQGLNFRMADFEASMDRLTDAAASGEVDYEAAERIARAAVASVQAKQLTGAGSAPGGPVTIKIVSVTPGETWADGPAD